MINDIRLMLAIEMAQAFVNLDLFYANSETGEAAYRAIEQYRQQQEKS